MVSSSSRRSITRAKSEPSGAEVAAISSHRSGLAAQQCPRILVLASTCLFEPYLLRLGTPGRDTRGPSSVVLPVLCECLITSARYVAVHQCRDLLRQHDPL
ncbi:hypothetical protein PC116_g22920 [Phytophthora cactorum]|nr:hypothetical protein PC111_g20073 [Phytophthora cactorum]KAG3132078.1 hypothetical protein C6341_g23078 [Phytophthora cactorum]KAG3192207.1 hypothetical protein PC128_g10622 [Phytophthora cactorum]KAG4228734.1 hypothetical protein PC116_g22920 [Phytophthora cactorum]